VENCTGIGLLKHVIKYSNNWKEKIGRTRWKFPFGI